MSNLAYVAPNDIRPNRDRESKCEIKETARLWIIEFDILPSMTHSKTKGCAIVKAYNANEAIKILMAGGQYNGSPKSYGVNRVEEVIESPDVMLICEQIL